MPQVIKTSSTPNPLAVKFHLDCKVISSGSKSFVSKKEAEFDSVASELFNLNFITSVFYINDIVTINKKMEGDWNEIIPMVADILEDKLVSTIDGSGATEEINQKNKENIVENFSSLNETDKIKHINLILDETIRPGLAGDGGGLEIIELKENQLVIHYEGACGSCPSSTEGTLNFIRDTLKSKIDPKLEVVTD